ncbi:tail fiber/spike domain-containing protein, partial [Morganella morganii]
MTVSTELSHEEYTGNGVTTDFDFRFRIFEAKHLVVSVADQDGTERILTNGTDYTLRGVGSYRGGKVILKMPLAQGWKIGIARDLPAVQETDLRNQGKFFAEVHEDAFDYLTMLIQKSLGYLSLCLRKPSFISDHYDAKGNKISNLGKPVKDGDAVDLGTMKEHVSAKDKRSLRVADKDIPALPGTSVRRNKQLGFDSNGMPLLLDPAETGALGYVLMDSFEKGAVITSRYQALHWQSKGEYYRWDGDLPKTVPAGSTPESAGGVGVGKWVGVGDASLRGDLNKNTGVNLIGGKGDIPSKFDSLELMGAADLYVGDTAIVNGTKYIICGESRPFNASLHTIRTKHGYATASNLLDVIIRTPKLEFTVTSQADFQFPSSLQGSYYLDRTNQILLISTTAESGSVNQSSKVIVYNITGSTLTEAYRTSSISMAHGDRFAIQDDGVDYYLWAATPNSADYVTSSYNIKRFKLDASAGNGSFDIDIPIGGTFYQYLSDFNYDSFLVHNYTLNTMFEIKHADLLSGEYKPTAIANGLETVKQLNHGGGQYFIYSPAEKKWLGLGGLDARTNRNGMCFISKFDFDAGIDYATLLKTDSFDFGQEPQSFFYKYNPVKSAYDIYVCVWSSGDSSVRIYNVTDESTNPVKEIYYGGFKQNEYVASSDMSQYEGKSTVLESRLPLSARSLFIGGNAGNAQNDSYNPADFQLSQVAGSLKGTRRIVSI